ncbi:hypothetical protein AB434_1944 [Heyndrickxia coagulans]|uniref:Uncharacterized protein n=1 Tax=Heyndrickxia coagulans TaxID=1398 RepID=A0AAN0T8P4_HEYCO|nr:hypothetical protein SB48_HM08orf05414 [Heyndrickxia coagulans]AKN54349.1 hypothetical protein AB434_1944 [Heyndrickxia coagulans]
MGAPYSQSDHIELRKSSLEPIQGCFFISTYGVPYKMNLSFYIKPEHQFA